MSFRNNFGGRGLVAAMEDDSTELEVDQAEPEIAADTAESALLEAEGDAASVLDGVDQIESTEADADTLEAVADQLESTEEEGGLDPQAAAVTEIALEAIYTRVGIRKHKLPAVEAYNEKGDSRIKATRVAVEDIREKVKKVWAAIVEAFNKVIDWIKNFLNSIFSAAGRLKMRAESMKKALAGRKAQPPKGEKVKGGFLKFFDYRTVEEVIENAAHSVEDMDKILAYMDATGIVAKADSLVKDQAAYDAFSVKDSGDMYAVLSGGRKAVFKCAGGTGESAFSALASAKVEVASKEQTGGHAETEALDVAKSQLIVDKAITALEAVMKVTKPDAANALTGKTLGAVVAKAKTLANLGSEEDKATLARSSKVGGAVRNIGQVAAKARTLAVKDNIDAVKAALDYVQASVKIGVDPEEKKDDKGAKEGDKK